MNTQSKPLRLAQALNNRQECEDDAADELRRLHAENETLRQQHLEAHRNSAEIFNTLVQISLLTHLGGEVAEYGDVVEAVRQMRDRTISEGWRQCAQGQRTTQHCAVAEQARAEEREAAVLAAGSTLQAQGVDWQITEQVIRNIRARGEFTNEDNPSF